VVHPASVIRNPVLQGFNPDPSICRSGNNYYIATSTFEWYPGVQIHHSTDLVNWSLVCRPLQRASQLDMRGNPDSCGVWAPCLSFANKQFWLVYTDVKRLDGNFKDAHNYLVTSPSVTGPWSDPVYINSSGFDPSLFHDEDGRKWFTNMVWNHRGDSVGGNPAHPAFDGILLQEFDPVSAKLFGPVKNIFKGSPLGLVEAPHLFKRNNYYYLTVAEGGTGYQHAVTLARSTTLEGPYELHPDHHVITAKDAPHNTLQRTGHGQIVETADGQTYHTFLCSRPLENRRSPLGRETGIEKCGWRDDGWLYLQHGGTLARESVPPPHPETEFVPPIFQRQNFRTGLPIEFQWLRTPVPERLFELTGDALRLHARESLGSWFEQSLVARRQQHHAFDASTELAFFPASYQQAAGLIYYYNRHKFHFLSITWHETLGRVLSIMSCNGDWPDGRLDFPLVQPVAIGSTENVELGLLVDHSLMHFRYRVSDTWQTLTPALDASVVSDEGGRGEHASFTGAFVGMAAFDTSGAAITADFTYFDYQPVTSSLLGNSPEMKVKHTE